MVAATPDRLLLRLLVRMGQRKITELAERDEISAAYITRLLRMAFLSPALVEAVLAGRRPVGLTAASLMQTDAVEASWAEQARLLEPAT